MSARYDAMVEAWERENGRPCPFPVRLRFLSEAHHGRVHIRPFPGNQERFYGAPGSGRAELRRLIAARKKDQKKS